MLLQKVLFTIIFITISCIYLKNLIKKQHLFIGNELCRQQYGYQIHKHHKIIYSADPQATTLDRKTYFEHLNLESNRIFLIHCNFYHCRQNSLMFYGSNGGAIFLSAISIDIDNCKFRNNYVLQNGGAAYIQSSSSVRLTDTIISSNHADNFCGGIFLYNIFKCYIANSNFSNNYANEVSSLSIIYCKNCVTTNLIFDKNRANINGTLFIEKSKLSDENSYYIQNTASVASSIRFGGYSEVSFKNTAFFDKNEVHSIVSSQFDTSKFVNCLFTKNFQNDFLSNGANFAENNSVVVENPNYINLIPLLPVPTYPPLRTPIQTKLPDDLDESQSNRNEQSSQSNLTQWKSLIIFLYIFFIIMLVYVLANHFSWFSKRPRMTSLSSGGRLIRRSHSNLSLS